MLLRLALLDILSPVGMDLEEMDNVEGGGAPTEVPSNLSAIEALKYLDTTWYTEASRKARWMDLIGDYAGNERFILDGRQIFNTMATR